MPLRLSATRAHKYGAKPTQVDGIRFDSKKEARRYMELTLLQKAGAIQGLELQPVFPLWVSSTVHQRAEPTKIGEYHGDFSYWIGLERVVEDVKGYKTPLYRWKLKHVEAQYGIKIQEV